LIFFRQGYQRGWTEAASVGLMILEAKEQGMVATIDPEWPSYKAPVKPNKKDKEGENIPTPAYVVESDSIYAYKCGYYRGWMALEKHGSVEKFDKAFLAKSIAGKKKLAAKLKAAKKKAAAKKRAAKLKKAKGNRSPAQSAQC
jgi:hypothetical protein